jgi:hypothetical protein
MSSKMLGQLCSPLQALVEVDYLRCGRWATDLAARSLGGCDIVSRQGGLTMKTLLLLLAALALSAHRVDIYPPKLRSGSLTDDGRLNGAWWHFASPQERGLYVKAWEDITGRKLVAVPKPLDSANAAVADELNRFSEPKPQGPQGLR